MARESRALSSDPRVVVDKIVLKTISVDGRRHWSAARLALVEEASEKYVALVDMQYWHSFVRGWARTFVKLDDRCKVRLSATVSDAAVGQEATDLSFSWHDETWKCLLPEPLDAHPHLMAALQALTSATILTAKRRCVVSSREDPRAFAQEDQVPPPACRGRVPQLTVVAGPAEDEVAPVSSDESTRQDVDDENPPVNES